MNRQWKNLLFSFGLLTIFFFSASVMAANCYLFKKNTYSTKPDGTKCWYQDFRTGSTSKAPPGYARLSSANIKTGENCAAKFTSYVKGQVTTNSWSCVKGTLNGTVVATKGSP